MVSFINVGRAAMTPLPIVLYYDSTAAAVNQDLIVILRQ
jgi:hypothetical protein